jgi:hypothetical protein
MEARHIETPAELASVENAYLAESRSTAPGTGRTLARAIRRALLALATLSALAMTLFWAGLTPPR